MKTQSNTYSAGAILDYLPKFVIENMEDLTIYPEHEDTEHRGGISFILTLNNVSIKYKVIHNFMDLFDMYVIDPKTGDILDDRMDVYAGDFMNMWEVAIEEFNDTYEAFTNREEE